MKFHQAVTAIVFLICIGLTACNQPAATDPPPDPGSEIVFVADEMILEPGQCTFLRWDAPGGFSAFLNGEEVPLAGDREVCPEAPELFELQVDMGTHVESQVVEVVGVPMEGGPAPEGGQSPEGGTPEDGGTILEQGDVAPGEPAYLEGSWVGVGGPPGGLGYDIRMRPDNPEIMFVTDAAAGIFKSVDGGATWTASNTGIPPNALYDIPIFCLTIDPHNYDVIWAGTQITGHLYKSVDNGASWQEMDNGITEAGRSLRGITIDPQNGSVMYAAAEIEAISWAHMKGLPDGDGVGGEVYKSTDGGQSWRRVWSGDNLARYIWVDPTNSNRVYVSTGIFDRQAANASPQNPVGGVGILRSDDGGETWQVLDAEEGLNGLINPSLFMHPADPQVLLASATSGEGGGVYISRNGGDSWQRAENGPPISDAVEIALSNPDVWYSATESSISRSDDGGQTWQNYPIATADRSAGIPIDLQVDPHDEYRIFVNNYGGGNMLSLDGGETWADASVGYSGASIAGMIVLPGDGSTVLVGANTGGFRSTDYGATWQGTSLPSASTFLIASGRLAATDSGGNLWTSGDGGTQWAHTSILNTMAEYEAGRLVNDVVGMRAFAAAPSNPQVMYVGFGNAACSTGQPFACLEPMPNMFRSTDGGSTWQELSGAPFAHQTVLRVTVHPEQADTVYAATMAGIYLSTDGGNNWRAVEAFNQAATQYELAEVLEPSIPPDFNPVSDIVFDPHDANTLFAASQRGGIWISRDGGEDWTRAAAGLEPNEFIVQVLPDPSHPGVVYAASRWSGVYYSTDGGASWQALNEGLPVRNITGLALSQDGSVLYAGSSGRGLFRLGRE